MAGSASQNPVPKLYLSVVDDVISNIREAFLDDGVDESVLEELKSLWLGKLKASKALEAPPVPKRETEVTPEYLQLIQQRQQQAHNSQYPMHVVGNTTRTIHPVHVPIQLAGATRDLTNPATAATMALPTNLFQQQILHQGLSIQPTSTGQLITLRAMPGGATLQAAGTHHVQVVNPSMVMPNTLNIQPQQTGTGGRIMQLDGACDDALDQSKERAVSHDCVLSHTKGASGRRRKARREVVIQLDGAGDTSSEEDEDEEGNEEGEEEPEGAVEEPLNSDDDISEADPSELFDTENVVVCQYDKINRNKNRWKFQLKDGIMNLNGRDYVFQRATGDAEW